MKKKILAVLLIAMMVVSLAACGSSETGATTTDSKNETTANTADGTAAAATLVDIELLTGRHHQIRVQLSGAGMPIAGDKKYDEKSAKTTGTREKETPALCAYSLSFLHPKTGKQMDFTVLPEGGAFEKFRKE